ncbi:hypothetical protein [Falsiroseomonas sp. CW058]
MTLILRSLKGLRRWLRYQPERRYMRGGAARRGAAQDPPARG